MILLIELLQLKKNSIYALQEENIMIYYWECKTTTKHVSNCENTVTDYQHLMHFCQTIIFKCVY